MRYSTAFRGHMPFNNADGYAEKTLIKKYFLIS